MSKFVLFPSLTYSLAVMYLFNAYISSTYKCVYFVTMLSIFEKPYLFILQNQGDKQIISGNSKSDVGETSVGVHSFCLV